MLAVVLGSMFFALLTICLVFGPCRKKKYFVNEGWGGNGVSADPDRGTDGGYMGGFNHVRARPSRYVEEPRRSSTSTTSPVYSPIYTPVYASSYDSGSSYDSCSGFDSGGCGGGGD